LRLDALGRVDEENRSLTGGQASRNLIGEVHVSRRVDHVEDGILALVRTLPNLPWQPYRLALDRDPALALDVHPVEVLRSHLPRIDHPGDLQHPVRQRRLSVVDVGDDAEVS
jgi:hypothetical protein